MLTRMQSSAIELNLAYSLILWKKNIKYLQCSHKKKKNTFIHKYFDCGRVYWKAKLRKAKESSRDWKKRHLGPVLEACSKHFYPIEFAAEYEHERRCQYTHTFLFSEWHFVVHIVSIDITFLRHRQATLDVLSSVSIVLAVEPATWPIQ